MANLNVRNVPDRLYRRIRKLAEQDRRSLTAEVIAILSDGVERRERLREGASKLQRIREHSSTLDLPENWGDSTELLREDRAR